MTTIHHAQLAAIRTFPSLIKYLRDEMGWPIGADSFEDLTFDYSAEELGIDAANAAKIEEIKRLRPLASGQPWGIFFVKFEPKRLPVVALRRILSQVVLKKRATANAAEHAAWAADDLLFVSNYGEGDARHITFAHFSQTADHPDLPTLKVLGWDNLDTPLHISDVADHLTRDLAWPDDPEDAKAWRQAWRGAFTLGHREVVTTSRDLSVRLAELARAIRDRIRTAMAIETEKGPLKTLMKAFQDTLVHDLDAAGFADMYAQTIAYGLLSSRISDPKARTADDFAAHMRTSPFLRELMQTFLHIGGRRGTAGGPGIDFDELGVSEVMDLLDRANMEAVVRDFGDRNPQEDPVIHFYELFLKEYDAKQRMQRGVFYTPRPVVSFIVRSVDELLRTQFGLPRGLADTTTWAEIAQREQGLTIPDGTSPAQPFVQILDPATGTGTFLVEIIGLIHQTMVNTWKEAGNRESQIAELWNEYVPKHLLPRLHGYELLMAPYAIAHLKVGLKLYETGYRFGSDERARIYLTNALEPAHDFSGQFDFIISALAHEAKAVNEIKKKQRFTVVVGNPPYSVLSANLSDTARALINPYRSISGQKIEERSMLRLEMHLQDDYVKFMASAQSILYKAGDGVLGLVTNNGYLDNLTLRGVRFALADQFDQIVITDLHGSRLRHKTISGASVDENVFDIEQGVAIFLGLAGKQCPQERGIKYIDLRGSRTEKYRALLTTQLQNSTALSLKPQAPNFFCVPRDEGAWPEYEKFVPMTDVMPVNISGIVTAHDDLVIDFDDDRLIENARLLRDQSVGDEQAREALGVKDNAGWKLKKARAAMRTSVEDAPYLHDYGYRPFDTRRIYYHPAIVWADRRNVMSHVLDGNNLAIATCRQLAEAPWRHVFVTRYLQDDCFVSNRTRERSYHFPVESNCSPRY